MPKKSIAQRIRETTEAARAAVIPMVDGPDPRLHRHEVGHAVHQQKEAAAGSFEEAFDYEDPNSERFLPEGMDGVIQMKTREEVAAEEGLAKAIKDPTSVIGKRKFYNRHGTERDAVSAGHELAKRQVTEHHKKDPGRLERLRAGLGVDETGLVVAEGSDTSQPTPVDEQMAREAQQPHQASRGCSECGAPVGYFAHGLNIVDNEGTLLCLDCQNKAEKK